MSRELDLRVAAALGYRFWFLRQTRLVSASLPGEDGPWAAFREPYEQEERSRYDAFDPADFRPEHHSLLNVPEFSSDMQHALTLLSRELPGYMLVAPTGAAEPWAVLSDETREVASHTIPAVAICHAFLAGRGVTVGRMARDRMLRDAEAMLVLIKDSPDSRFRPYIESDTPAVVLAVLHGVLRANDDFSHALAEVNESRAKAESALTNAEHQRDCALAELEVVQHERDHAVARYQRLHQHAADFLAHSLPLEQWTLPTEQTLVADGKDSEAIRVALWKEARLRLAAIVGEPETPTRDDIAARYERRYQLLRRQAAGFLLQSRRLVVEWYPTMYLERPEWNSTRHQLAETVGCSANDKDALARIVAGNPPVSIAPEPADPGPIESSVTEIDPRMFHDNSDDMHPDAGKETDR